MAYGNETKPAKRSTLTLTHNIPLRPETEVELPLDVMIVVPRDLTPDEAARIGKVLASLALDWRGKEQLLATVDAMGRKP